MRKRHQKRVKPRKQRRQNQNRRRHKRSGAAKVIGGIFTVLVTGGVLAAGAIWFVPKYTEFHITDITGYPESYDLRDEGLLHPVRNQGTYGSCFTFATICAMENRLLAQGIDVDLSEWAYFVSYRDYTDGSDGITDMAVATTARAVVVPEKDCFYPADNLRDSSANNVKLPQNLLNRRDYYITDYYVLSDSSMSAEEIGNNLKYFISRGYACTASVYTDIEGRTKKYMNNDTGAWYVSDPIDETDNQYGNHVVTVIGWDDNYPKENFNYEPENDGAWLIQNSWGTDCGDDGYYWISYEDKLLKHSGLATFEVEPGNTYSNVYTRSFSAWNYWPGKENTACSSGSDDNTAYIASKLVAESNDPITAVGFYATADNVEYDIWITSNLEDFDPAGEKPLDSGTVKHRGFNVADLNKKYDVEDDDIFYVVVKLHNDETGYLAALDDLSRPVPSGISKNMSFISADGKTWMDTIASGGLKNEAGTTVRAYVCISAYASNK